MRSRDCDLHATGLPRQVDLPRNLRQFAKVLRHSRLGAKLLPQRVLRPHFRLTPVRTDQSGNCSDNLRMDHLTFCKLANPTLTPPLQSGRG